MNAKNNDLGLNKLSKDIKDLKLKFIRFKEKTKYLINC